jgi:copper(I)-binding protein
MRNPKHLVLSALLSLSFTAALAGGAVTVTDPYVRAVPPGQPNSAVFMGLVNGTGTPRALVGGHSEVAEVVELHTHTMEDGMMKMRRVERIALPADAAVALEPGGLHVMLIGLKRDLSLGDQIDITLDLDDGGVIRVQAPVREVQPLGKDRHH